MISWLFIVKIVCCAYGSWSRRNHLPGFFIPFIYLIWNILFTVIVSHYNAVSPVWYLICAAGDLGLLVSLLIIFESRALRNGLILFLSLCVVVNICTYIEDPTPYSFFYRNWHFFIQLLGLCECFVICTAPSYNAADLGVEGNDEQGADQRRCTTVVRRV